MKVSYSHHRSARRIEEAKRKARPELINFGWDTLCLADKFSIPDFKDNIARYFLHQPKIILADNGVILMKLMFRIDGSKLSLEEFREKYERPRVPCIITGLTNDWEAHKKWNVSRISRKYRNQRFKCGEDDDGYSVKLKMKYYADYMANTKDDSPLYIFDSGFGDRHKTNKLLADFEIPLFFKDDLFGYANYKKRPPHRYILNFIR
ncbi:unnamed protein product [Strongylus vulgaris]|uniref:Uncharacterized protein n=1 Tax=Strongylus vulgaris TaxID=40348 RepID=A0A3P7ITX6_STRVU|nr:unnamed protein product [Strongylus vulgaris]